MKYVSIDIETTGLEPFKDDVLEVGAVIDNFKWKKPIEELPTFHCYIVKERYSGNPYAFSMHPTILRRIATKEAPYTYLTPDEFAPAFCKWLVDNGYQLDGRGRPHIVPAGKNFGSFDRPFMDKEFDFSNKFSVAHRSIDPVMLYFDPAKDVRLPNLQTCLDRAGINEKVDHTAVSDAIQVVQLLRHHYSNEV